MSKKSSTALTLTGGAPSVLTKLDEEIAKLKHIEESVYKTTGVLEGFPTNIKVETKIENLIRAYASVKGREESYDKAAAALGVGKSYPAFNIGGGTAEDWHKDIQLRINIINHKQTLDKLSGFKEKMTKFLSAEQQQEMLLNEMNTFLGTK